MNSYKNSAKSGASIGFVIATNFFSLFMTRWVNNLSICYEGEDCTPFVVFNKLNNDQILINSLYSEQNFFMRLIQNRIAKQIFCILTVIPFALQIIGLVLGLIFSAFGAILGLCYRRFSSVRKGIHYLANLIKFGKIFLWEPIIGSDFLRKVGLFTQANLKELNRQYVSGYFFNQNARFEKILSLLHSRGMLADILTVPREAFGAAPAIQALKVLDQEQLFKEHHINIVLSHENPVQCAIVLKYLLIMGFLNDNNLRSIQLLSGRNVDILKLALDHLYQNGKSLEDQAMLDIFLSHLEPLRLAVVCTYLEKFSLLTKENFKVIAEHENLSEFQGVVCDKKYSLTLSQCIFDEIAEVLQEESQSLESLKQESPLSQNRTLSAGANNDDEVDTRKEILVSRVKDTVQNNIFNYKDASGFFKKQQGLTSDNNENASINSTISALH